ncbi:MAG TPA: carboxylating nicotinate-nucleotide diphosphorylase [Methanocorpusculum sp.]|nr:carboxylating nicotinate-nucleotide diphosphorylase [Methanocorpusculum sp.]
MTLTPQQQSLISFFNEDAGDGDITTSALLEDKTVSARIEAREDLIAAGVEECVWLFSYFGVSACPKVNDGDRVSAGARIISLTGSVYKILSLERTCLNLMGRMSGIATSASKAQQAVSVINSHARVAATRKTAPGLRYSDKKAVTIGGGLPHRYNLSDAYLIKDTHRALIPIRDAISRAEKYSDKPIECEVESVDDAVTAASCGADTIMFDNMSVSDMKKAVDALKSAGLRDKVKLELSGGIKAENFAEYSGLDVDIVSMGALTHSVKCADISLEIDLS